MKQTFLISGLLVLILMPAVSAADNDSAGAAIKLTVAAAQLPVSRDIAVNAEVIDRAMDTAIKAEADVLLTPEGSLSGYTHRFDQAAVDEALKPLLAKAKAAGLALALGTCYTEPDDGECYNQIRFYDADGSYRGFHSKTLLCGSMTTPSVGEINHYATRPLRTFEIRGITVGGLICNDLWANPGCTPMPDPHLTQQLSDAGARIVFQAVNGGRDGGEMSENVYWHFHETNQRLRARAGKLWLVTADNCAPTTIPCSAPSGVINTEGKWVAQAARQGEEVVVYTIELDSK